MCTWMAWIQSCWIVFRFSASTHSPTGILMQKDILEWVSLAYKQSKKIKDLCRKFWIDSERKNKTSSISRNRPSKNCGYLLLVLKLPHYGQKRNTGKELAVIFWARLTTNIPKASSFHLKKELIGFSNF